MPNILDAIKKNKVLLSDGAWGTMLIEKGLDTGDCPESWNLTRENDVLEIAQTYAEAGADIITTNSFGASRFKLEHYELQDKTKLINIKAAEISRKAAGDNKFVFGSVGPTGKLLLMEDITTEELYDDFKERVQGLESGGADLILIETMTDLQEAMIGIKAAKDNTNIPVACTFTFDQMINGDYRTMMGISPEDMINALKETGVDIIGSNCGNGFEGMIEIAEDIKKYNTEIPVLIQANAGMPCLVDGKSVFPENAEHMSKLLPDLLEQGISIVGGCCGTSPEYISNFAKILRNS